MKARETRKILNNKIEISKSSQTSKGNKKIFSQKAGETSESSKVERESFKQTDQREFS